MALDFQAALANYMTLDADERRTRQAIEKLEAKLSGIETSKDIAFQQYSTALAQAQAIAKAKEIAAAKTTEPKQEKQPVLDGPMPAEEMFKFSNEPAVQDEPKMIMEPPVEVAAEKSA